MSSASDQLVKHAAFDQMRNGWSNACTFDQMRVHAARLINAEHRNSNLLLLTNCAAHLAILPLMQMKQDWQLRNYAEQVRSTQRMVSHRRVSQR